MSMYLEVKDRKELTPEEKAKPYSKYYYMEMARPDQSVIDRIESGLSTRRMRSGLRTETTCSIQDTSRWRQVIALCLMDRPMLRRLRRCLESRPICLNGGLSGMHWNRSGIRFGIPMIISVRKSTMKTGKGYWILLYLYAKGSGGVLTISMR